MRIEREGEVLRVNLALETIKDQDQDQETRSSFLFLFSERKSTTERRA